MRVCHVSPHLPPDQAANALLPAQLGVWSARSGDDVTFVTQDPAQGRAHPVALPGEVRRVNSRRSPSPVIRFLRLDAWSRARAIMAALDEVATGRDLVHLHSNGLIIEVASSWARRRGLPTVLTLYGTEIWHYRRRWPIDPFTRAYMTADAVTFYSQRLLDRALSLGLKRTALSVVYPPVSESFVTLNADAREAWRRELGIHEPLLVLNVKRLHELAGQRYLIEAFARVARRRNDIRLVICGTGPLKQELEERAAVLGVSGKVTFAGLVANDEVARYAAVADVFVLPSLLEALPTVAVEALAAGTPVISADHPGGLELHEIFGDDVSVVPRQNPEALADRLEDALTTPRRTRDTTAALVKDRFSPAAVERAYAGIYSAVLAGTTGATGTTGPR
jgi:glycosyltransferase involved in cell wall biosynthesis